MTPAYHPSTGPAPPHRPPSLASYGCEVDLGEPTRSLVPCWLPKPLLACLQGRSVQFGFVPACEPTHTLVPCWMPKPLLASKEGVYKLVSSQHVNQLIHSFLVGCLNPYLPPRNKCAGCFAPTCEPTHTLIPCWLPKPLLPKNECTGWVCPSI